MWRALTIESSALAHAGLTVMLQLAGGLILRECGIPVAVAFAASGAGAVAFYWLREWDHAARKTGGAGVTLWPATWHRKSQLDLAGPVVAAVVVWLIVWGAA
jgi:hypothetical protein